MPELDDDTKFLLLVDTSDPEVPARTLAAARFVQARARAESALACAADEADDDEDPAS